MMTNPQTSTYFSVFTGGRMAEHQNPSTSESSLHEMLNVNAVHDEPMSCGRYVPIEFSVDNLPRIRRCIAPSTFSATLRRLTPIDEAPENGQIEEVKISGRFRGECPPISGMDRFEISIRKLKGEEV